MQIDIQSLADAIKGFLPSLKVLAGLTSTTIDDGLVSVAEAIVSNEALLQFLQSILGQLPEDASPQQIQSAMHLAYLTESNQADKAAEASGVSIALILQWLPVIIKLLGPLFSRRG